jgi:hypothetical protein
MKTEPELLINLTMRFSGFFYLINLSPYLNKMYLLIIL